MAGRRLPWFALAFRLLAGVVLLAVAFGLAGYLRSTRPEPARVVGEMPRPRVIAMKSAPVTVRRPWVGFGTAAALDATNVPARLDATVVEVPPSIVAGAAVSAGTLLVVLDDTDSANEAEAARQAVAEIDAQLERMGIEETAWAARRSIINEQVAIAQADYDRVREAIDDGAARPRELDEARRVLNAALHDQVATNEEFDKIGPRRLDLEARRRRFEAQRRQAEENQRRTRITSPIEGRLQAVDVELGESVTVGQRVARVVDLRVIEIPLRLPAGARPFVRPGDDVTLAATGSHRASWTATVARIAPEDDPQTRTMQAYVELRQDPADPHALAPGQFVLGSVVSSTAERRTIVPRRAVEGDRLQTITGGMIASRAIEPAFKLEGTFPQFGLPDRQWVALAEPLAEGTLVVVNASRALADGQGVEAVVSPAHARSTPDDGAGEASK